MHYWLSRVFEFSGTNQGAFTAAHQWVSRSAMYVCCLNHHLKRTLNKVRSPEEIGKPVYHSTISYFETHNRDFISSIIFYILFEDCFLFIVYFHRSFKSNLTLCSYKPGLSNFLPFPGERIFLSTVNLIQFDTLHAMLPLPLIKSYPFCAFSCTWMM